MQIEDLHRWGEDSGRPTQRSFLGEQFMVDVHLETAMRLIEEGRADSVGIIAYTLISIAVSFRSLLDEMNNSKCGHGVVTLFAHCQDCDRVNR